MFFDDFDSNSLQHPWSADETLFGDGNAGFAYYRSRNVNAEDGKLLIRPGLFADLRLLKNGTFDAKDIMVGNCEPFPECATYDVGENCTIGNFSGCRRIGTPLVALNPTTSGRINTKGKFDFQYGRLEARLRLPKGDYLWPAFWLMPTDNAYGSWPDSGEVDILEARSNDPNYMVAGDYGGRDKFEACLHYSGKNQHRFVFRVGL